VGILVAVEWLSTVPASSYSRRTLVPAALQSVESELGSHFKLIARSGSYKLYSGYESIEAGSGP